MRRRSLLGSMQPTGVPDGTCKPQMTSLIDVMTILLVFLIHNFSSEGSIVAAPRDCELPVSTAQERPEQLITVTITTDTILVDGAAVASVAVMEAGPDLLVQPLYHALRRSDSEQGVATNGNRLMIQADRSIAFSLIKRIMYTCGKAGYTDFTVMVMRQG